ncbi:class I SAM-dependent methyltransferase [Streptomyces sp. NPDC006459]|uniref:class I SAM-dependent methyltransferase n=1 Tax=Streptomyces sp. NPDC006459 TaxID=3154303 RepID=UPI0033AD5B7F
MSVHSGLRSPLRSYGPRCGRRTVRPISAPYRCSPEGSSTSATGRRSTSKGPCRRATGSVANRTSTGTSWTAAAPGGGRAVEVGCGLGLGCALALEEYGPAAITGIDIHPQQLQRAREANSPLLEAQPHRLRFVLGAAEDLPLGDAEFDCLYSVEAAQHFPDLSAFAREAARVLRPGGRVAVTSFFSVGGAPESAERLAGLLDSFASGLDIARPVSRLADALTEAGFADVRVASIGPQVWPGWDRWLARLWEPGTWPRNFLAAWEQQILDYYLVTATRP